MFRSKLIALLVAGVAFSLSLQASALTLDFEEMPVALDGPFALDGPDLGISQGFHFYRPDGQEQGGWIDPGDFSTGNLSNVALDWCDLTCGGTGTIAMELQIEGGTFDLVGLDYAAGVLGGGGISVDMDVTGYLAGGGTVSTTLNTLETDLVWDAVTLGAGWTDLVRVDFTLPVNVFGVGMIDNVVVANVVPVPAAVWLFMSALAGLGWFRRRGLPS